MIMKLKNPKLSLVITAITIACIFRIMPHWPNFTPIAAIALMSGALISNRLMAFVIPFLALAISDLLTVTFINSYFTNPAEYFGSIGTLFIYLAFGLMILMGMGLGKNLKWSILGLSAIGTATLFFLLSNFGVWLMNPLPKNALGLLITYEMAIPFFLNNIAGDLFYSFLMFGIIALITEKYPQFILQTQKIKK